MTILQFFTSFLLSLVGILIIVLLDVRKNLGEGFRYSLWLTQNAKRLLATIVFSALLNIAMVFEPVVLFVGTFISIGAGGLGPISAMLLGAFSAGLFFTSIKKTRP
ncbi:MAG: hypothetical protein AAF206_14715 [Bacteroidota bacterium]